MAQNTSKSNMTVMVIAILALLAIIAYAVMQTPDNRTAGEKISDAAHELSEGNVQDAGRALQNRTPMQKMGDAIENAGDKIDRETE